MPASPRRGTGRVQAEPLAVVPSLLGQALATPVRRAWALGLDLLIIAAVSAVSLWWLVLSLVVLAVVVRWAMLEEGIERRWAQAVAAALLVLSLAVAWQAWQGPPEVDDPGEAAAAGVSASASSASSATGASVAADPHNPRRGWRAHVSRMIDELGLGLGWSIVYFSLLPAVWQGRTVGKRLFGLRIVVLSGERLSPLRGLKRYGGYVAGMATGGLGFAQVFWEPNRQALHDKAAHTVVLDTRQPWLETSPQPVATPALTPEPTQEKDAPCKPPSTTA